jgi:nucleotide-binding universal stress UspA family protein
VSADIIVSYDGTPNDDDALALGKALAAGGAKLALAYVRHSREFDPQREVLAQHDARRRLQSGLDLLGEPDVATHVIFSISTNGGLEELARSEGAAVIVFGSDYRTSPGRAEPNNTAQRLLDGGPVAIAVARAGLRTHLGEPLRTVAVSPADAAPEASATATALAAKLGATLLPEAGSEGGGTDLIVVASQPGSPAGRVALGGSTRAELNSARGSVLVLTQGTPVSL